MKSSLKVMSAVVALMGGASGAYAAIDTDLAGSVGAGDLSGELFVSVFRNVPGSEQSSLFDTGITAAQLIGGTVANGTVLGNVGSFFSTAPAANFVFNGGAIANGGVAGQFGPIFTTNNVAGSNTLATNLDLSGANSINVNMRTFVESAQGGAGNVNFADNSDWTGLIDGNGGFHGRGDWNSTLGGAVSTFSTEAGLDTPLALYAITINETFDGFVKTSLGYLTAELATGNIVFNTQGAPAVPLPAAVWLLGSGLAGLVGFSRRRRIDAVAA